MHVLENENMDGITVEVRGAIKLQFCSIGGRITLVGSKCAETNQDLGRAPELPAKEQQDATELARQHFKRR